LNIAAMGMMMAYLLLVVTGTIGVLLVLLWLFLDASGTTENIGREKFKGSRSVTRLGSEGKPWLPVESKCWEDEAA
jgi:hypothetical protein